MIFIFSPLFPARFFRDFFRDSFRGVFLYSFLAVILSGCGGAPGVKTPVSDRGIIAPVKTLEKLQPEKAPELDVATAPTTNLLDEVALSGEKKSDKALKKAQESIDSIDALLALQEKKELQKQIKSRKQKSKRDGALKIALLTPMKRLPQLSTSFMRASELALFESRRGDVELMFFDSGTLPDQARRATSQAISQGADIILGPLFGDSVAAAAPVARRAGVPLLGFTNSGHLANPGIYIFGLTPDQQMGHILNVASEQGARNIALFVPADAYGRTLVAAAREWMKHNKKQLGYLGYYDPKALDVSLQVRQLADFDQRRILADRKKSALKRSASKADEASADEDLLKSQLKKLEKQETVGKPSFDALVIGASSGQKLRTVASLFSYYDAGNNYVKIYGLQNWDNFGALGREPTLRGAHHVTLRTGDFDRFTNKIKNLWGKRGTSISALAYDSTLLAIVASEDGIVPFDNIESSQWFSGAAGAFRLYADGRVVRRYGTKRVK